MFVVFYHPRIGDSPSKPSYLISPHSASYLLSPSAAPLPSLNLVCQVEEALESVEVSERGPKEERIELDRLRPIIVAGSTESRPVTGAMFEEAVDPVRTVGRRIVLGKPNRRTLCFFLGPRVFVASGLAVGPPTSKLLDDIRTAWASCPLLSPPLRFLPFLLIPLLLLRSPILIRRWHFPDLSPANERTQRMARRAMEP